MKKLKDKDRVMMQELYNQQDTQVDLATISRDANDLTSQLNAISKEFTDISSQRKVLNKKYQQVKDAMQQVVNASRDTQQKVNERVEKIKTYSRELMETKKQIDQINQDTDNAKSLLIRFANVLYRANNEYYNGANDIDEIKILIKSDNIASTLSSEQLVAILAMRFDQLIDYLNSQNLKLEEREKRLDTLRLQYKDQVTDYNNEVELLKEQKKYLLEFLVLYRQDKINLDLQAQDLFDDREKLRAQIAQQLKETQDLMKNTDSVTAKKINSIEEREDGARFLSRPVYPIYNYTDAKNDPTYLSLYGDTNK